MASSTPVYWWHERRKTVGLDVLVPGLLPDTVKASIDEDQLTLEASNESGAVYSLSLQLFAPIQNLTSRCVGNKVILGATKMSPGPWRQLRAPSQPKPATEKPDMDKMEFFDSDDETWDLDDTDAREPPSAASRGPPSMSSLGDDQHGAPFMPPGQSTDSFSFPELDDVMAGNVSAGTFSSMNLIDLSGIAADASRIGPWLLCMLYCILAPYTKVEESFNVQATHDLVHHNANLEAYDHFEFPGVVPRTFLGPIALSVPTFLFSLLRSSLTLDKTFDLIFARMCLGTVVCVSLDRFREAVSSRLGKETGIAFAAITCSQFHLLFYASRPLANSFALALTTFALSRWMKTIGSSQSDTKRLFTEAACVLAFTGAVFRGELVVLAVPLLLVETVSGSLSVFGALQLIASAAAAGVAGVVCSTAVDSLLWQRLVWPEGEVMWFNIVENKSHEWGVMSAHWYFTSALPKVLMASMPLAVAGCVLDRRVRKPCIVAMLFVGLFSLLAHKEVRFVIYSVPLFNSAAAAAVGYGYKSIGRKGDDEGPSKRKLWRMASSGSIIASFLLAIGFVAVSSRNYPGGDCLATLHQLDLSGRGLLEGSSCQKSLHIDNLAAITGASRFGERPDLGWTYSKEEGIEESEKLNNFSVIISERPAVSNFRRISSTKGFAGITLSTAPNIVNMKDMLHIHVNEKCIGGSEDEDVEKEENLEEE